MTMIDAASGWFEVVEIKKKAECIGIILDRAWFLRHPRLVQHMCDNGNKFLRKDFQETLESHGVEGVATTVKNPQANLVGRVHKMIGNMLRTQDS